jgi:hypothetical protein
MRATFRAVLLGLACGLVALNAAADEKGAGKAEKGGEPATVAGFYIEHGGVLHVFYRTNDGDILEMYRSHKGEGTRDWTSRNLMTDAKAPKAGSNPSAYFLKGRVGEDPSQHVIYRGSDNQIHELFLAPKGEKWANRNLSEEAKAPKAAGDPCGFVSEHSPVQHVFFRTADGAVCDLFRPENEKTWKMNDLTAEAKAPKAAGDPWAYLEAGSKVGTHSAVEHVVYRGEDGQIQELFLGSGQNKWGHNNLSREAKAPKATGDPCAYVRQEDNIQHVFFRGEDGGIYDLFRNRDGADKAWHVNNVATEAKAPRAGGDPFCYLDGATQHVVYRTEDEGICELFLAPKQDKWKFSNLTAEAKAPKATGDPTGFTVPDGHTQHVFFLTSEGSVFELYNKPEGTEKGWHGRNLTTGKKP